MCVAVCVYVKNYYDYDQRRAADDDDRGRRTRIIIRMAMIIGFSIIFFQCHIINAAELYMYNITYSSLMCIENFISMRHANK